MDTPEHAFLGIALVSSLILAVQLVLSLIGAAGVEMDVDVVDDVPDIGDSAFAEDTGLGLISTRSVIAFFVGFGWAGLLSIRSEFSLLASTIIAFGVGCVFLFTIFYLMRWVHSLAESGNINYANAVGQTGTVYLPIPGAGKGNGVIQVKVQGRLRELSASTDAPDAFAVGARVRVVNMIDDATALVRDYKQKDAQQEDAQQKDAQQKDAQQKNV